VFSRISLPRDHLITTTVLLALGGLGGLLAWQFGTPLPFMLGSLVVSALAVALAAHRFPVGYQFPQKFRLIFIALIGVMIGAQVSPDLIARAPELAASLAMITLFVVLAHALNTAIFRYIGGYDRATAFYSGTPGGLLESIAMGEAAGANIRVLTIQQFLRIVLVLTLVPLGFTVWSGAAVGSAGGMSFGPQDSRDTATIGLVFGIGLVGLWLGHRLRLPAAQLTGPMFAAAILSGSGLVTLSLPIWLVDIAQVVIGASLGVRFLGVTGQMLGRALSLSLLSVLAMLALGIAMSLILHAYSGTSLIALIIAFAPGGVTEMSLVALSLQVSPAFVALHHIYRIVITVVELSLAARFLGLSAPEP